MINLGFPDRKLRLVEMKLIALGQTKSEVVGMGLVHGRLVPKAVFLSLSEVTYLEGSQARLSLGPQGEGQHSGGE